MTSAIADIVAGVPVIPVLVIDRIEVAAPLARALVAGGLDVLASNAGIVLPGALMDLTVEAWERTFAINTRATWLLARAAHPHLRTSRGALIATGSISASQATAAWTFGLVGFTVISARVT